MQSIYREYDIRGIFEEELNEKSVYAIGYYLGAYIRGDVCRETYVGVGFDARTHSPVLARWLIDGLLHAGCSIFDMGMVTTGINYFTNFMTWEADGKHTEPDASIMITGSHNPPQYNGFKITVNKKPFFGAQITELGEAINTQKTVFSCPHGSVYPIAAKETYISYLVDAFSSLRGMKTKIAIDCGNGVAGISIIEIFKRLGLDFTAIYEIPDGTFPNHHPDPSVESNLVDLRALIHKNACDIGFAFDGDADRIAVLTDEANIKGDQLALIFARAIAKSGKKPIVVGEVKCSKVMYDEIDKIGTAIMYKTGHSNLKMKLKEVDADLAAEVSGHLFFNDKWFGFDDAVYAALRVLELIHNGVRLNDEIASMPKLFSTDEIKITVTEESKFAIIDAVKTSLKNPPAYIPPIIGITDIDGVRVSFAHGWGLVRASNTTPVLVTRFEADSAENLALYKEALEKLIQACMQ